MVALPQRKPVAPRPTFGQLVREHVPVRVVKVLALLVLFAAFPVLEQLMGNGRGLLIGMVVMAFAPTVLRDGGPRFHPLDPETLIPGCFFLSCGYAPLVHLFTSDDLKLSWLELPALEVAFASATACALVCTLRSHRREPDLPNSEAELRVTTVDRAVLTVGVIGFGMVAVVIATVGIGSLLQMSYGETYQAEEGMGTLTSGWFAIQLTACYLVSRILDFRRAQVKVPRVLLGFLIFFVLIYTWNSILGRRGPLIWLMVSMTIVAHIGGVVFRRVWFLAAVVVLSMYSFLIEGMRANMGTDVGTQIEGARARLDRVDNPFVIGDVEAVWNNLVVIVNEKPSLVDYPGESGVIAILSQVPKPIWPQRPRGLSLRYVEWIDPQEARAGGGFAFNAAAEGYLNFGETGAALETALMTLLFFSPVAACARRKRSALGQAISVCIASYAYNQYRGEIASMMKITLAFLATIALIELLTPLIGALFPVRALWGLRSLRSKPMA